MTLIRAVPLSSSSVGCYLNCSGRSDTRIVTDDLWMQMTQVFCLYGQIDLSQLLQATRITREVLAYQDPQ